MYAYEIPDWKTKKLRRKHWPPACYMECLRDLWYQYSGYEAAPEIYETLIKCNDWEEYVVPKFTEEALLKIKEQLENSEIDFPYVHSVALELVEECLRRVKE